MDQTVGRRVAALMGFEAATLVVGSLLHLSGSVQGRSEPFNPEHAGVAEAVIATVLACGAVAMVSDPRRMRAVGLATNGFAVAGFLLGLTFTTRGGHLPDVAYHLIVLPFLAGTLLVLLRLGPVVGRDRPGRSAEFGPDGV